MIDGVSDGESEVVVPFVTASAEDRVWAVIEVDFGSGCA